MARTSQGMASNTQYAPTTPMPPGPPMQQSQVAPPPKAFGDYASVPQQEESKPYPQYPSPPMDQQQQRPPSYFPPPGQGPLASSPPPQGGLAATSPSLTPSVLSASPSDARQSYYKPPLSPNVTEVDGTLGNPGIPSPISAHGQPNEVDGTMGNPSVPLGGHGIPAQGVPGGSPSSTEIAGNPVRASLNAPFTNGPYEMPHDRA